jgi:hypothetical protein
MNARTFGTAMRALAELFFTRWHRSTVTIDGRIEQRKEQSEWKTPTSNRKPRQAPLRAKAPRVPVGAAEAAES